jgi:hypothetical protein
MPRHQRSKGVVGIVIRILPQQRTVVPGLHSPISVRRSAKADNLFADLLAGNFPDHATDDALTLPRSHSGTLYKARAACKMVCETNDSPRAVVLTWPFPHQTFS